MTGLILLLSLGYTFWNGLHDAPTILAQVFATKGLEPRRAILLTGFCELIGAFLFSGMVLKTMSFEFLKPLAGHPQAMEQIRLFVLISIAVALLFNIATWRLGLPSSSTHALFGAMAGAGWGWDLGQNLIFYSVLKMFAVIVASALAGGLGGWMINAFLQQMDIPYALGKAIVEPANILGGCLLATLHGANDVSKGLGLFLLAAGLPATAGERLPYLALFALTISFGMLFGENRILRTLGLKLMRLRALDAFAANGAGIAVLGLSTAGGLPISSTQTLVSATLGAGAAKNKRAVRWMVAGEIALSWAVTLPICAGLGWLLARVMLSSYNHY